MLEVSSTILKAIIKGCKLELLFGNDNNIFHTEAKIYDDSINFAILTTANIHVDENFSLAKIMQLDNVQIKLYDELSVCQYFGTINFTPRQKSYELCILGNPKKIYSGSLDERTFFFSTI